MPADPPVAVEKAKKVVTTAASRGRKQIARNVPRPANAEQRRSQAAYRAMEALMESDAVSPEKIWLAIAPLTGRELHEVSY